MKTLLPSIAVLTLMASSSAFAASCPNFSGFFNLVSDSVTLNVTVTQQKCATVSFSYYRADIGQTFEKTYTIDGVRRQTAKDQNLVVYETASIKDNALINLVEFFDVPSSTTTTANASFKLDSSNNLDNENDFYDVKGKLTQTTEENFIRQSQN
jgi:hypothetical protein